MRQLATDIEQHAGMTFFQLSAGLGDTVDLRQNFVVVWRIGADQRLHDGFFFLYRSEQIDQIQKTCVKHVVHFFLLISRDRKFLREVRVIPPASGRAHAQAIWSTGATMSAMSKSFGPSWRR